MLVLLYELLAGGFESFRIRDMAIRTISQQGRKVDKMLEIFRGNIISYSEEILELEGVGLINLKIIYSWTIFVEGNSCNYSL